MENKSKHIENSKENSEENNKTNNKPYNKENNKPDNRQNAADNRKEKSSDSKIVIGILAAGLFLVIGGAAIFFYPTLTNYLAQKHQTKVIQNYMDNIENTDEEVIEQEWAKAVQYNENLAGDPVHDPFVPGSGYALPENYLDVLNMNDDEVMGYIVIPKINVNLPIYHGSDEEVLQKGAGHIEQTFLPIGTEGGHAVITGHRGLPRAEMFTRLDELEPGDIFIIHVLDRVLAYEVDQITTVLPDELENIRSVPGEDFVTLLTCTPYGVNTHRLMVRGRRTEYIPEEQETSDPKIHVVFHGIDKKMRKLGIQAGIAMLLFIMIMLIIASIRRRFSEKKKQ